MTGIGLDDAADQLTRLSGRVRDAVAATSSWSGPAATACARDAGALAAHGAWVASVLRDAARLLGDYSSRCQAPGTDSAAAQELGALAALLGMAVPQAVPAQRHRSWFSHVTGAVSEVGHVVGHAAAAGLHVVEDPRAWAGIAETGAGALLAAMGAATEGSGVVLDATGIGLPVGAALNAAGAVAMAGGAGVSAAGAVGVARSIGAGWQATAAPAPPPTPEVADGRLGNLVRDLFKGTSTPDPIGTGSTADAVRNELATGESTYGKDHMTKARQYVTALQKWLERNPGAAHRDRLVAQSLLDDLRDAIGDPK